MKKRRIYIFAGVAAIAVVGCALGFRSYALSYHTNCEPAARILMDVDKKPAARLDDYFSRLRFVKGIPLDEYGHANPLTIAMVGLLNLQRYCETGNVRRLDAAITQRKYLAKNLERTNDGSTAFRFTYDFANAPYASGPGWASAMSQSAGTLLMQLLRPRFQPRDDAMISGAINAALRDIDHGGIYSNFENGTIFWEEVAWPGRPSLIMNGAQVATFYYDLVIEQMAKNDPARAKLHVLNERAKDGLMLVQDRMIRGDGKGNILYDLTTVPMNTREKGHYAYLIAVEWLEQMKAQGRKIGNYLDRLEALPQS